MTGFKRKTAPGQIGAAMRQLIDLSAAADAVEVSPAKAYEAQEADIVDVPVGDILPNPYNARRLVPQSKIEAYAASMRQNGQLVPAVGFRDASGHVTLIDGHCRLMAAKIAGLHALRVALRNPPEAQSDLYFLSRAINAERAPQTILDDALAWRSMIDHGLVSQADIARRCGVSESVVSKTVALSELPAAVMAVLSEQEDLAYLINGRALYELYLYHQVAGTDATLALLAEAGKRQISSRDIEAKRKAVAAGKRKKPRSTRQAFTFAGKAGEIRRFEAEGRIELSIRGLSSQDLAALHTQLMHALGAESR